MYDKKEYNKQYYWYNRTSMLDYIKRHQSDYSRYYSNRYRNDPEFKEIHLSNVRRYYGRNRQKIIDINDKRQYENYHNDPEYRRKQLARNKKWRETHPELVKQYNYNNRLRKKIFNMFKDKKKHGRLH